MGSSVPQKLALVISTYNQPRTLELLFLSLMNQTYQNFEIFIADDGSNDETKTLIQTYQDRFFQKIHHHWHPDSGYKKAKINNQVFKILSPELFPVTVCVDHDVILDTHFLEDHASIHVQSGPRTLFMGRRIDLSEKLTKTIGPNEAVKLSCGFYPPLFYSALRGETKNFGRSIRITHPFFIRCLKRNLVPDLLGSNFSISTELLHEVNGYNEDYQSYWGEDGDLFVRVRNTGATLIGIKGFAIQYHLYHKRLDPNPDAVSRYQELLKDKNYVRCKNGITNLLAPFC